MKENSNVDNVAVINEKYLNRKRYKAVLERMLTIKTGTFIKKNGFEINGLNRPV
jgi:hypothetical protein